MRGLNTDSIDLVYLDPPFNSKRHYGDPLSGDGNFKDKWTLDDVDHFEHGEIADANEAAYKVIDAAGLAHSKGGMAYLIFMAVRLVEIQRILKPTGSVFLHCDPTMGAYLKLLMDAIFGRGNFVNEIAWCYSNGGRSKTRFCKKHDTILYYANGGKRLWTDYRIPVSEKYLESHYRQEDEHGRRCRVLKKAGNTYVYYPEDGMTCNDWWADIPPLNPMAKERKNYPTQKPKELLDRIIRCSTREGDLVFDPFCGCATTLVTADGLDRRWIGCDISPIAVDRLYDRLTNPADKDSIKTLFDKVFVFDVRDKDEKGRKLKRKDPLPMRTDTGQFFKREDKHEIYGKQGGYCFGCWHHHRIDFMHIDHRNSRHDGGQDDPANVQLLCAPCNMSKNRRSMSKWLADKRKSNPKVFEMEENRRREVEARLRY